MLCILMVVMAVVVLDSSWLRLAESYQPMRLTVFSGSAACGLMSRNNKASCGNCSTVSMFLAPHLVASGQRALRESCIASSLSSTAVTQYQSCCSQFSTEYQLFAAPLSSSPCVLTQHHGTAGARKGQACTVHSQSPHAEDCRPQNSGL